MGSGGVPIPRAELHWEEPRGTLGRDLGHCWALKLFCASPPASHTTPAQPALRQPLATLRSLGMPLGNCTPSLHHRFCHGAALPPSQAPVKGLSRVTAIDISSAGSPSGSDGILEHGNGPCLVEKANLPQLYRISAGVLWLSPLPPALPRSRHTSLKL